MSLEKRLSELQEKINAYGVDRMHKALVLRGVGISNAYVNGLRNGRFKTVRKDVEVGIWLVLSESTETLDSALRRSRRPGPRPRPTQEQRERYCLLKEAFPDLTWTEVIEHGLNHIRSVG